MPKWYPVSEAFVLLPRTDRAFLNHFLFLYRNHFLLFFLFAVFQTSESVDLPFERYFSTTILIFFCSIIIIINLLVSHPLTVFLEYQGFFFFSFLFD